MLVSQLFLAHTRQVECVCVCVLVCARVRMCARVARARYQSHELN